MKKLITLMALMCVAFQSYGDILWTGGGADDNINNAANWGGTLPTSDTGIIDTGDTVSGNADITGYQIIQNAGTVSSGIRWDLTDGSWTMNGGSFSVGSGEELVLNGTQTFTVSGGTFSVANELVLQDADNIFTFAGGTSIISDGYRINNGKIVLAGSTAGTVAFNIRIVTAGQVDWLTGSKMAMTVGVDEWAEAQWNAGNLTYNNQDNGALGTWAEVTAAGGLGNGENFSYDSVTETLTVVPEPAVMGLIAISGLGLMLLHRRMPNGLPV